MILQEGRIEVYIEERESRLLHLHLIPVMLVILTKKAACGRGSRSIVDTQVDQLRWKWDSCSNQNHTCFSKSLVYASWKKFTFVP